MTPPTHHATSVEAGLAAIAEGLRAHMDAIAGILADEIVPHMPDMGPEGERQILASCRANVVVVADLLERPRHTGAPDGPVSLPPPPNETTTYMRMLVHRGLDVDALIEGYRIGHGALWRCCSREAFARVDDTSALPAVLDEASDIVFRFMNATMRRIDEEFAMERHAYVRWPIARKLAAVVEVLGHDPRLDAAQLTEILGYDVSRRHVGFVVQAGSSTGAPDERRPRAEVVAARLARMLSGGSRPCVLPSGGETTWMWLAAAHVDTEALEAGRRIASETGATIGMGEPGDGLEGFRETHVQAQEALDAARCSCHPIRRYRDIALQSALTADPERAGRMMRLYLGELDAEDESAVRLRTTLSTLLETGFNQRETARRLGMHVHSIAYRIRRIEEMLGFPVAERQLELRAALLVRETLPCTGADPLC